MSQATINEQQRALVTKIENFVEVTKDGGVVDADFVSKALPEGLSQEQLDKALTFMVDLPEAFDVVVAEKSVGIAKDDAEVKSIKASFGFNNRVKYTSNWERETAGADGQPARRGVITGKLTVEASVRHQETLTALEALAADL